MKMICHGIDISRDDVSCNTELIKKIENDLLKLNDKTKYSILSNITGDDIVVTSVIEDDNSLETVNKEIYEIFKKNAESFDDLDGVSLKREEAGEGISYVEIDLNPNFLPDAVVIGFDTYCGESFVDKVAECAVNAATNMDYVGKIGCSVTSSIKHIPGVGYVSQETDDPVIVVSVENVEHVGVVAGAMMGAILGNKNTYLVKRNTPINVVPGSVIFSVSAVLNGNVIDLAEYFSYRSQIISR